MSQQGAPPPLRPIAPRTQPCPSTAKPSAQEGRMKRVSVACTECKRRRKKCNTTTTGDSCAECAIHGHKCIFEEFTDGRRKVAAKRVQADLQYYQGFTEQLLESIRTCDGEGVEAVVNVIRSNASHEEIRNVVTQILSQRTNMS